MRSVLVVLAALVASMIAGTAGLALADGLAPASGPVVLEVRGGITRTNAPGAARFDLAMLQALGVVTIATTNPWMEGAGRFEGVAAAKLLDAVGASGSKLVARALNDYKVEIPIEDLRDKGAFLAFSLDGRRLTARDKGPVWLLYPFDDRPELRSNVYYSRSIWQLTAIEIQ